VAIAKGEDPPPEKQKPNFAPTGKLAAEANTIKQTGGGPAVVLKYHEPPEARKPPTSAPWRMYVFKGSEIIDTIPLATQSCWLFGREAAVVDYLVEHPSSSKQHAVIQFRYIEKTTEFGDRKGKVRPYVIDLESANGTVVNGEKVPEGRYVELRDADVVGFGHSTREYVVQLPPAG
jgi:smad nuclear-interacting protein 1